MPRAFKQVDVFTNIAYRGNPLAVVLDGVGLTPAEMQSFTDWTNLSEATFLLPPEDPSADYKVRIFCPGRELPFAGHPTLGSCHAWLESGGKPKREFIVQECGVGLVKIRRDGDRLAFAAPPLKRPALCPRQKSSSSHGAWAFSATRSSITPGATMDQTGAASCSRRRSRYCR